jgi:hypothetical protein
MWRSLATGAFAALAVAAWTGAASAGDTVPLKQLKDASTVTLGLNDDLANTEYVARRGGGGGRSGYRGGGGGYRGGRSYGYRGGRSYGYRGGRSYGYRGYRGGRSYGYRGYRGGRYYGRGYYRPYRGYGRYNYGRRYYRPYYRSYYRYRYYPYYNYGYYNYGYYPGYYQYSYPGQNYDYDDPYCPINLEAEETPSTVPLDRKFRVLRGKPQANNLEEEETPEQGEDTYPYDGGPDNPIPLPDTKPNGVPRPKKVAPSNTRYVSSRAKDVKLTYRAYGE